jgi:ABC-type transporter Mla subunit MlaD
VPAAAYTVLGNLAQASFRLAQTAEQIDAFLTRELDAGRLGHDRGDDPVPAVTTVHDALGQVTEQAADLGDSFRRAASALAPVHALDAGDGPSLDPHTTVSPKDQEVVQIRPASADFPHPIGDVLPGSNPLDDLPPELRSPPQPPHPRRGR